MYTIKFASGEEWQKQFARAVRHNVNNYFREKGISQKGNLTLVSQTIAMLSFYLIPFVLIIIEPMNGWLAFLLVVIMGIGMAGVGMCVMHDAVHGSYSKYEWINKLMGGTMYLLGSNVFNWKIQHNVMHHAYTNIEGYDEDIGVRGPIRLSKYAPLRRIHRYQYYFAFVFYGLMTLIKLTKEFSQLARYNREGVTGKYLVHPEWEYARMVAVKVIYVFIFIGLPLLFSGFTWWQVILGFLIMHWVAGFIMSTIFQMAHVVEGAHQFKADENGVIHHEWAVHELLTTSDFARNNLFLNWYAGGLNYQIEHHLFPQVSHVHYRKIAPLVEKTAHEFGLSYNVKPTFFKALGSHIRRLKQLGQSPSV